MVVSVLCNPSSSLLASAGWISRAIYVGDIGAKNWLALARHSAYPLKGSDAFNLNKNYLAALENMHANTFVSLGPGDGLHDVALVKALKARATELTYFPVEISQHLLDKVIATVGSGVRIPIGFLCDFEVDSEFIDQTVREHGEAPVLYAMLGGTICNLDLGEASLLGQFRRLMQPDDSFLLDFPLAGPNWSRDKEPRLDASTYTPEYIRLLAGGLVNRGLSIDIENFIDNFANRVRISVSDENFAGAQRFVIQDRETDLVIINLKRYDWASLQVWLLSQGFRIDKEFSKIGNGEIFGMGVVLLSIA